MRPSRNACWRTRRTNEARKYRIGPAHFRFLRKLIRNLLGNRFNELRRASVVSQASADLATAGWPQRFGCLQHALVDDVSVWSHRPLVERWYRSGGTHWASSVNSRFGGGRGFSPTWYKCRPAADVRKYFGRRYSVRATSMARSSWGSASLSEDASTGKSGATPLSSKSSPFQVNQARAGTRTKYPWPTL